MVNLYTQANQVTVLVGQPVQSNVRPLWIEANLCSQYSKLSNQSIVMKDQAVQSDLSGHCDEKPTSTVRLVRWLWWDQAVQSDLSGHCDERPSSTVRLVRWLWWETNQYSQTCQVIVMRDQAVQSGLSGHCDETKQYSQTCQATVMRDQLTYMLSNLSNQAIMMRGQYIYSNLYNQATVMWSQPVQSNLLAYSYERPTYMSTLS